MYMFMFAQGWLTGQCPHVRMDQPVPSPMLLLCSALGLVCSLCCRGQHMPFVFGVCPCSAHFLARLRVTVLHAVILQLFVHNGSL